MRNLVPILGLLLAACAGTPPDEAKPQAAKTVVAAPTKKAERVPAKASANGRYAKLLRKVHAPQDVGSYGKFNDWGWWDGTSYAGQDDLPPGYWVYVAPDWYVWGEDKRPKPKTTPPVRIYRVTRSI